VNDDYISREAALNAMLEFAEFYSCEIHNAEECVIEYMNAIPAADVKPVVRGKWKLLEGGAGRCSNCKSVLKDVWDYDGSDPFCSECGADMREVSTSEESFNSEGTTRKEQEHNG
jgi:hypothetical protein